MKKKNLLILPIAVLALGVATSCNNNNSGSAYFKDSTIKEYEKYFEFNGKDFTTLDVGLANYVLMQSGANLYNANKVTNNYTRSLKGNFSNDLASSLEEIRKEKQEKNYDVSDLANRDASNVLINSDKGRDVPSDLTDDRVTNTIHEGYSSYELFNNDVIEYNSEDSIYSIDNDNNRTLVQTEKEKDTYWYELEDGDANVYTQYDGEKYGFTASHQNLYTTLGAMSKEEASRELQFYFNNIVVGFAEDSLSSSYVGDTKKYAYTSGDDIYIVNRTEGSTVAAKANLWVNQYLLYLSKQSQTTATREQLEMIKNAFNNLNVYLVNNPLKPMTNDIMIGCGFDYQKFLSYFLPCVPVNMSVIKISKHDFGWGVDYNAWKSQLLLLKNENEKVLSKPIAYSSYYDISEVTYSKPAGHSVMKYDPNKEMDNPFNIRLKIWEMRDYGEDRDLEEHPDRYEIDEENPVVDEIAYSSDSKFALSSYNEIYDLTSYYWQAYSDLEEKKIRVYSGYIDMDYFSRPLGLSSSLKPGTGVLPGFEERYESYPVFSLEVVGSALETPFGLIGYDDIPSSNLGKQNNEYFACPLDTSISSDYYLHKRIVSNVSGLDGYNVTFYVDADPEHLLTTYGQIIDYKYQEGLTISTDGGIKDLVDVIDVPDFDIREV